MGINRTALAVCVLLGAGGLAFSAEAAGSDRDHSSSAKAGHPRAAHSAARPQVRFAVISDARAATGHGTARRGSRHNTVQVSQGGISCVPYARQVTGMQITGNGWEWWGNAAGSYARGHRPEPGSVLAFRSTGNMRYGHVAVVSKVLGTRHLLIDHANWGGPGIRRGSVMRSVHVVDVSPTNDWTDVRVQVGHGQDNFGRSYPTYGFIYNRPDSGRWLAEAETRQASYEEIAEAPEPDDAPRAGQRNSRRGRR